MRWSHIRSSESGTIRDVDPLMLCLCLLYSSSSSSLPIGTCSVSRKCSAFLVQSWGKLSCHAITSLKLWGLDCLGHYVRGSPNLQADGSAVESGYSEIRYHEILDTRDFYKLVQLSCIQNMNFSYVHIIYYAFLRSKRTAKFCKRK